MLFFVCVFTNIYNVFSVCGAKKMQHNTAKLKPQAEAQLLEVMEEEDRLYNEVQEMQRKYLLRERNKQMNEILDLQVGTCCHMGHTEGFLFSFLF